MELTSKQQQAVEARVSVAVTAGAGTGKTAMLAKRFLHHVASDGFSPLEIAAITFTEKAAAELRSRIRAELAAFAGDDAAAQADAAQISTIHSMAARICRDFYDLAEIPTDFRMLDETDAAILVADWFDEAIGQIEPGVVKSLGYTWLRDALRELFKDPPAAEQALKFDENHYRELIERARELSLHELLQSECWREAEYILNRYQGKSDDKLEQHRVSAVNAMADIAAGHNISNAIGAILGTKLNVGSKANWPEDSLQKVKDCIKLLRTAVAEGGDFELLSLHYGKAEDEMCRRVELLRQAFSSATEYLRREKLERRVLDFSDLEYYALKVLEHPEAKAHYAERWKAMLIDEFQDTNPIQEKLLRALSEAGARLTIVGDGKQSIYGFRRADPRVFRRFRDSIGNEIILDRTFRAHAGLVSPVNVIFQELLGELHQPLDAERKTHPREGPFIEAHSFCDEAFDIDRMRRIEARFIAAEINRLIDSGLTVWDKDRKELRPVKPSDIAILSRTRAPLDIYIDELVNIGIPAVNSGGGDLLETRTAKDMTALLRFVSDPSDDIALVSLLRGPFFAVSDIRLYELSQSREKDETWWALLSRENSGVERAYSVLSDLLDISRSVSAEQLFEIADEKTGYTGVLANLEQGERRMADWFGFLSLLRRFASLGRTDVFGACRYLKDLARAGSMMRRPPLDSGNAVSLMTIHAAKGLEWPVVFIPNLSAAKKRNDTDMCFDAETGVGFTVNVCNVNGSFERVEPAIYKVIKSKKKSNEADESARILYVALTRAQDRLYLTSAGKPGNDFEALATGLEAAGIGIRTYDSSYEPASNGRADYRRNGKPDLRAQVEAVILTANQ
jgi:ATP-dependent helicase/nuclease subunit A